MKMKVLDWGYVELVESWGTEESIICAARMSTGKGFNDWDTDFKLLRYLYKHKHMTPFEMCGMIIEVKAPIFVFREWHRHRTQSYNEMSARYIPLPDQNYVPSLDNIQHRIEVAGTNKQAGSATAHIPNASEILGWMQNLEEAYVAAQLVYDKGLALGIPKEVARLPVPVARYSKMRASTNLRNWLQFLSLRLHPTAQWEIRQYANAVVALLEGDFPKTMKLFLEDDSAK